MTSPSESTNPYEPPKSTLVEQPADFDEAAILTYMGGSQPDVASAAYYAKQLRRHRAGLRPRMNLAALVFGSVWCFWRKLYLVGCAVWLVEFVASVLIVLVAAAALSSGEASPHLAYIPYLALPTARVPLALIANRLYFRAAKRAAGKLEARGVAREEALERLRRKGGTTALGAGAAILVNIVFGVLDRLAVA